MKKLASTKGISKEEWIRLRMQGIGGSEAATAVGISRYHSRINLYLQKIGDLPIPQIDNERLYWGTVLEDVIAKEFSKRTGYGIQKLNYIIQHDDFPFMIGDIDRLILDDQGPIGILECKNTSAYMEKEWTEDNFPIDYIVQIQHYLAITGYQFGYFAVLLGGNKFISKRIDRDEEFINMLISKEKEFWHFVETKTIPPLDGTPDSTELVKSLYPHVTKDAIMLDSSENDKIKRLLDLKQQQKDIEYNIAEIENQLKAQIADHAYGFTNQYTVSWNEYENNIFDVNKFKSEHLDLYKNYVISKKVRKFSVTQNKEVK